MGKNFSRTVHGLILTSDFSLYTPLNLEKWRFIEECIPKLDYKGIQILIRFETSAILLLMK